MYSLIILETTYAYNAQASAVRKYANGDCEKPLCLRKRIPTHELVNPPHHKRVRGRKIKRKTRRPNSMYLLYLH